MSVVLHPMLLIIIFTRTEMRLTDSYIERDFGEPSYLDYVHNIAEWTEENPNQFLELLWILNRDNMEYQIRHLSFYQCKKFVESIMKIREKVVQHATERATIKRSEERNTHLKIVMRMDYLLLVAISSVASPIQSFDVESQRLYPTKIMMGLPIWRGISETGQILHQEAVVRKNISDGEIKIVFSKMSHWLDEDTPASLYVTVNSANILSTDGTDQAETTMEEKYVTERSDVVLISTISSYSTQVYWTIDKDKSYNTVACEWMSDTDFTWETRTCKTRTNSSGGIVCTCHYNGRGTAALALAFIVGEAQVSQAIIQIGRLIEYICISLITMACVLYMLFCKFIGRIRLVQLNIAICILAVAIADFLHLFITPATNFTACAFLAVFICYFLLTLFFWYFICGLNTLLMITKPDSEYHDFVSINQRCLPILWIVYIGSAVLIAIWFATTGEVVSNNSCVGPSHMRWYFLIIPITTVLAFNCISLVTITLFLTCRYMRIRNNRVNESTHIVLLCQLTVTMGIPYVCIYLQFLNDNIVVIMAPLSMALTIVSMFILVFIFDTENRLHLQTYLTRCCACKSTVRRSRNKRQESREGALSTNLLESNVVDCSVDTSVNQDNRGMVQVLLDEYIEKHRDP